MDHLGEKHHDQQKPPMGCWCNGALNLGKVEWVQQLLALVEERVEKVLDRKLNPPLNSSSLPHQADSSVSSSLQLRFKGKLPETIYTKNNIEDGGASLELELCNDTGQKAEEISPELQNLKVMIFPLDGDFKVEDKHDWTPEEFERHVVNPRKDKPPLIKGNSEISLKNGFARIHGICFTDNSSHVTNGEFRLGARLIKGLPSGGVVRPAVSEAFRVKEDRVKDQKHKIPSPHDELWRLDNIGKSGYQRAVNNGVFTVLDFLELYRTDEEKLKKILQLKGKRWKETVKNAEACNLECAPWDPKIPQMLRVYNFRPAAHGKQEECKKVHTSTNQTPVHARIGCPYPTEQLAAPPPLYIGDYNVDGLPSNQICFTSTINTPYLGTAEIAQGNFEQLPVSSFTGAYGVNNTSPASDNLQLPTSFQAGAIDRQVGNSLDDDNFDIQLLLNSLPANDLEDTVEHLAKSLTSTSDQKLFNDSSANNPVTRKLVTVCYATKAATIFMFSPQQGSTSPKKKRKLQ